MPVYIECDAKVGLSKTTWVRCIHVGMFQLAAMVGKPGENCWQLADGGRSKGARYTTRPKSPICGTHGAAHFNRVDDPDSDRHSVVADRPFPIGPSIAPGRSDQARSHHSRFRHIISLQRDRRNGLAAAVGSWARRGAGLQASSVGGVHTRVVCSNPHIHRLSSEYARYRRPYCAADGRVALWLS